MKITDWTRNQFTSLVLAVAILALAVTWWSTPPAEPAPPAPAANSLWLYYAYEWNHYRTSQNQIGDWSRLIIPGLPLETGTAPQRLDLGIGNISEVPLQGLTVSLQFPVGVGFVVERHALADWRIDVNRLDRWSVVVGILGPGAARLVSPQGPMMLTIPTFRQPTDGWPVNYEITDDTQRVQSGTLRIRRLP